MVVKYSRAQRRHDRKRMFKRALKLQKDWWSWGDREVVLWGGKVATEEDLHAAASMIRDNMSVCSCPMCCNQRHNDWAGKKERLTMQELRADDAFKDGLKDWYGDSEDTGEIE